MGRWLAGTGVLAALLAAAALAETGDAEAGKRLWDRTCANCHAMDFQGEGPMHRGVYGRKAGSLADFDYSQALKDSTVVWDEVTLDRWLTDPQALIPGQRMNYKIASPADRADVIAYLKRESGK
jgi:cytochrome c